MNLNDFNIYPGIRPFDKADAPYYFGRDIQIGELKARLVSSNFLAIVGSSGTGKSSLVRAGLIPQLEKEGNWLIAVSRPENSPIANLAVAINQDHVLGGREDVYETKYTRMNLDYSSRGVLDSLKQSKRKEKLLLVIDQFEEIFRFKDEEENRDESLRFINLLLTAANETTSKVYIIITMRSDFLGRCSEFPGLPEKINEGQFLVPRLTRSQYKEAILKPLEVSRIKVSMSPSLTSRVLNDIQDDPDQLPVLQHALMRTWKLWLIRSNEGRTNSIIDIDVYEEVGGMQTALGKHARELLQSITPNLQQIAKVIFQRITEFNSDGLGIRRPTQFEDLVNLTGAGTDEIKKVIDTYRAEGVNFLMPPPNQELSADTFIDISHESLIRKWPELNVWMKEEQLDKAMLIKLAEDSDDYDAGKARLLSDRQLTGLLKWQKLNHKKFSEWASIYTHDPQKKLDFLHRSKSTNYRNYLLRIIGIPTLLIVILSFGYLYYIGRVEAEKAANEVLFNRSKDYEQIKILVADSLKQASQIATLNSSLTAAQERISELERYLKPTSNAVQKSPTLRGVDTQDKKEVYQSSSKELAMLRQQNEDLKLQLKELKYQLTQKDDSLETIKRALAEQRTRYASLTREVNNMKSGSGEKQDADFTKLSGTPILLYFTTQQDSIDGARVVSAIRKDSKVVDVELTNNAERINDLFIKGTRYAKGIYIAGQFTGNVADDFAILRNQLNRMNLGPYKVDKLTAGEFQALTRSKHNSGLVVLLGEQQHKSKQ
ncbi:MAG: ATP-binding protein [Chryseolinea sp.]